MAQPVKDAKMLKMLYYRLWKCRKVGHSPAYYGHRPVCIKCHGPLPGVWALDD